MDSFPKDRSENCGGLPVELSEPLGARSLIEMCRSPRFRIPFDSVVEDMDEDRLCVWLAERVESIIFAIEHGVSNDPVVKLSHVRAIPPDHRRPTIHYVANHFTEFGDDNETYLQDLRALKALLEKAA